MSHWLTDTDRVSITRLGDVITPDHGYRQQIESELVDEYTQFPKHADIQHIADLRKLGATELSKRFKSIEPKAFIWLLSQIGGAKRGPKARVKS